jgi:hypothetical protein
MPLRQVSSLLVSLTLCACVQSVPPAAAGMDGQPAVSEIAGSYKSFDKITESPVLVNPELAILCRGASQAEMDATRARSGPHANSAILVYMNEQAAEAFRKGETPYPVGAVIVKEKSVPGHTKDIGVGGMVKRPPGFDASHGDWEYFYFEDAAKVESGRIASCVQCHQAARGKDHVFGTWAVRE